MLALIARIATKMQLIPITIVLIAYRLDRMSKYLF